MSDQNISLSNNEKLSFISNFATMLVAGIPILEVVDTMLEDVKGNLKKILTMLREDLTQGEHIWTSLAKFPAVFGEIVVNIIRASEEAGTLETTLKDIRDMTKKEIEFNDKVKSALLYPSIIVTVFFAVLIVILVFVMPKIFTVFSRLRVELPLPTRILYFISNIFLKYPLPIITATILLAIGVFIIYKKNKKAVLHFISSLPLISRLAKEIDLTRFSRSLYLLLSSGVSIVSALELAQNVVVSKKISLIIKRSREMILGGKKLSEGLKENRGHIPNLMIKIIEAGEKSGSLDKSMSTISEHLDYQVTKTLQTLTVLLEPALLVIIGVLVATMMFSIIGPIYGLIGKIGTR